MQGWKTQDWKTRDHRTGLENVGLENVRPREFLGHLQRTTIDSQADICRLNRGMAIRRAKKRIATSTTTAESKRAYAVSTTTATAAFSF